ncbi:hypothetical protein ABTE06_22805, partial [Acinetobacter baumannii]
KIPEAVRRAFRTATSGRPGAVHLTFPEDILAHASASTPDEIYAEPECRRVPAFPMRPDADLVRQLAALLDASRRPVLVAG